jgi:hypothetical protein
VIKSTCYFIRMGHLQCQSLVSVTLQAVMAALVITLQCSCGLGVAALQVGYYGGLCPKNVDVENIVYTSMSSSYSSDKTTAPGVLRLAFHDCFVRVSLCPPYIIGFMLLECLYYVFIYSSAACRLISLFRGHIKTKGRALSLVSLLSCIMCSFYVVVYP